MHQAVPGGPHRAIIKLPVGGVEYKYKVDGSWRVSVKEESVACDKVRPLSHVSSEGRPASNTYDIPHTHHHP